MYDMPLVQKCLGPVLVKQSVNGLMTVSDNRRYVGCPSLLPSSLYLDILFMEGLGSPTIYQFQRRILPSHSCIARG